MAELGGGLVEQECWVAVGNHREQEWIQIGGNAYLQPGTLQVESHGYPEWADGKRDYAWQKQVLVYFNECDIKINKNPVF